MEKAVVRIIISGMGRRLHDGTYLKRTDIIDLIKEGIGHHYLFIMVDISTLYEVCEKLNVDPERFEASWKVEYIFD